MKRVERRMLLLAGGAALGLFAGLAGTANAQNALGTGNALDANPNAMTGPMNQGLPTPNFAARNLLITGDVVGGRGFQGSVGYRAAGDFAARLGSDDLFQYRAESAMSGLDYVNLGRSYDRLLLGQDFGLLEFRRSAASVTGGTINNYVQETTDLSLRQTSLPSVKAGDTLPSAIPTLIGAQARLDKISNLISTTNLLNFESDADPVGMVLGPEGRPFVAKSSSLRGLQFEPPQMNIQSMGLTSYDLARAVEDLQAGTGVRMGQPFQSNFSALNPNPTRLPSGGVGVPELTTPVTGSSQLTAMQQSGPAQYREILENIAGRYVAARPEAGVDESNALEKLDTQFRDLKIELSGRSLKLDTEEDPLKVGVTSPGLEPVAVQGLTAGDSPRPGSTTPGRTGETGGQSRDSGSDPMTDPVTGRPRLPGTLSDRPKVAGGTSDVLQSVPKLPRPLTGTDREDDFKLRPDMKSEEADAATTPDFTYIHSMGALLRHGKKIDTLSAEDKNRVNELIAEGEDAMSKGEYFYAERRFGQALRYTPGHPLAGVGVGHAQLGAGMYLSAGLTLRTVLTEHPEMIDTRYGDKLLPRQERINDSIDFLSRRMRDDRVRLSDRLSFAFLLAYMGHQLDRMDLVKDGLGVMRALAPEDRMHALLRSIWVEGQKPPQAEPDDDDAAPEAQMPAEPAPSK